MPISMACSSQCSHANEDRPGYGEIVALALARRRDLRLYLRLVGDKLDTWQVHSLEDVAKLLTPALLALARPNLQGPARLFRRVVHHGRQEVKKALQAVGIAGQEDNMQPVAIELDRRLDHMGPDLVQVFEFARPFGGRRLIEQNIELEGLVVLLDVLNIIQVDRLEGNFRYFVWHSLSVSSLSDS